MQPRAFAHARQAARIPRRQYGHGVKAYSLVLNLKPQDALIGPQGHTRLKHTRVPRHIGQGFLNDSVDGCFTNRDTNTALPGCINLSVGLVNAGDTKIGIATCNTTLTASNNTGGTQYTIGIVVSGYYTRNDSADDDVITVAQPLTSNFITGGGYLVLSKSSGLVPGSVGSKSNFGFNVKYNKSGTNLQGNVNIIVRNAGRVYQIKGTAISSLGVAAPKANFTGKANIQDITDPLNPIAIDGNATLQLWMTDKGEPGTSDTLGIQVLSKNGGMWFSSNWSGTKTVEQKLGGGNLAVR